MRLLAKRANERGDLFARLASDLFLSQGYDNPRINIHKTGREVDLKALHRLEDKVAVAECKAQARRVGGDALNKFAGVLQVEAEATSSEVQGYFISLSGFSESAREQEAETDPSRFVLLDGLAVQEQLVAGGMVVPAEVACDSAGRLATDRGDISLAETPTLLAHDLGWIWLCKYENHHLVTHFSLIHADGRPLARALADQVILSDSEISGTLNELTYMCPKPATDGGSSAKAKERYTAYLMSELGEITLEGLPADQEVGAKRIALEDLYVPLHIERTKQSEDADLGQASSLRSNGDRGLQEEVVDAGLDASPDSDGPMRELLGTVLGRESRLAVLAAPGAGKSTLVKRLAVAYASADHRDGIEDGLPKEEWLPLFVRCRTLGEMAKLPVWEILEEIPSRGEFPDYKDGFRDLISRSLRAGKILLLIDGLDEIASEGDRIAFVRQLRTFLGIYPQVALVLTSREAGFRVVAGAMSSMCEWYKLSEFGEDDVRQLTRSWHRTVVGKSRKVDEEASLLADTIIETDRVWRLARNPLLLTTLLLVKRWVGDLPRKRTVLYEKAIDVLLMTWNVEAHDPIESEEAIPQLAYIAHTLTEEGTQSLSSTRLARLLQDAREQMPEILGFARTSVSKFVERVESRSSLLVMTGHVEEDGQLIPNYEFRHLTFQEYLSAVALVEGYYDGHAEGDQLVSKLEPHFEDARWYEVVALANVRAGRTASTVVLGLAEKVERARPNWSARKQQNECSLLARALADEVQLTPELVRHASIVLGRNRRTDAAVEDLLQEILEGRYGDVYRDVITQVYLADEDPSFGQFAGTVAHLKKLEMAGNALLEEDARERISELLRSPNEAELFDGALFAMWTAFDTQMARLEGLEEFDAWPVFLEWSSALTRTAESERPFVSYAAAWALAWLSALGAIAPDTRARQLRVMLEIWREGHGGPLQKQAAWAFAATPPVDRHERPLGNPSPEIEEFIRRQEEVDHEQDEWREDRAPAAVCLAYYLGGPWSDQELSVKARAMRQRGVSFECIAHIASLGDNGEVSTRGQASG